MFYIIMIIRIIIIVGIDNFSISATNIKLPRLLDEGFEAESSGLKCHAHHRNHFRWQELSQPGEPNRADDVPGEVTYTVVLSYSERSPAKRLMQLVEGVYV